MNTHVDFPPIPLLHLRPIDVLARAIYHTTMGSLEPMPAIQLADLLRPLCELSGEMAEVCAGGRYANLASTCNSYLGAVHRVLSTSQAELEPAWIADLLTPIMVMFDMAEAGAEGVDHE